ncbi:MAG: branched-chain amino acid ABC transporter permease [Proteobacteria bacterium]|nr:branched-chain amino acid ABC transporter permease [Pseudomonadota bacterium]
MSYRELTNGRIAGGVAAALAAGAVVALTVTSETVLSLLTQATIFAIFALGVGILLRQNGMVSFGHAAFYGLGGYVVAILLERQLMSAEMALVAAFFGIALFAFLIGFVVVRVPGIAFGMLTLALGQMFYQVASRSRNLTGGADGINISWPDTLFGFDISLLTRQDAMFYFAWSGLVLSIGIVAALMASRFGATTEAIRDNEERARFIGIRTLLPRVLVFTLSGTVTALAGLMSAFQTAFISPESMHWSVSGTALMMVIIGGYRYLWGPALGAIAFFLSRDLVGDFAQHWLAIFGVALIVVIVFAPQGISGALARLFRRKAVARPAAAAVIHKLKERT